MKQLLEQQRAEAAIVIIDTGVGPMFRLLNAGDVNAEERVWKPGVGETGRVGEEEGDEEGAEGEGDAEAEGAEAGVDVGGGDDVVTVTIPEEDVGLEGGGGRGGVEEVFGGDGGVGASGLIVVVEGGAGRVREVGIGVVG